MLEDSHRLVQAVPRVTRWCSSDTQISSRARSPEMARTLAGWPLTAAEAVASRRSSQQAVLASPSHANDLSPPRLDCRWPCLPQGFVDATQEPDP